jgi:hypothetical protein
MEANFVFKPFKIDETMQAVVNSIKDLGFVAGGSVRNIVQGEAPRDYDIFCFEEDNFFKISDAIQAIGYERYFLNEMVSRHKNKETGIKIDVVRPRHDNRIRTVGPIRDVIQHFDFTVCRAAILDDQTLIVDEHFDRDIELKALRIRNVVCPLTSVRRIAKYATYGYKIEIIEILKLYKRWEEYEEREKYTLMDLLDAVAEGEELNAEQAIQLATLLYVD